MSSAQSAVDRFFEGTAPAPDASPALQALWWAAKGRWDQAHRLVQDCPGKDAAWVHAHLHRLEGDLANANYWYVQAGQAPCQESLATERVRMAAELLLREEGGS